MDGRMDSCGGSGISYNRGAEALTVMDLGGKRCDDRSPAILSKGEGTREEGAKKWGVWTWRSR